MSETAWTRLGSVAPVDLTDATLELHWAAQFLASAGQTFAEPSPDDSHRAMSWSPKLTALVSAPFAGAYPFRAALRPSDLTLLLVDRADNVLGAHPLSGTSRDEGYEWMSLGMATYLGGAPPVVGRPDYDMPDHPIQHGARFSPPSESLITLEALYDTAASTLGDIVSQRDDASGVLCWPHHFDMATLITLERGDDGAPTKTVGVGMAPMGGGFAHWYWYVTPWPYPDASALPALGPRGTWHTEGWTGAILTGAEVVSVPPSERNGAVRSFLDGAIEASITALGA
jgi:hypothetical protein